MVNWYSVSLISLIILEVIWISVFIILKYKKYKEDEFNNFEEAQRYFIPAQFSPEITQGIYRGSTPIDASVRSAGTWKISSKPAVEVKEKLIDEVLKTKGM